MNPKRWPAAAILLVLSACGTAAQGDEPRGFPDEATRRRAASTVSQVWRSAAEAELTSFSHVAVDSRENVYVPDFYHNRIVVFGPGGRVARMIGRAGSGPGEFRTIRSVQILPGDSLLVYDSGLGRVSVFAPDSNHEAYVTTLRGSAPWAVERTRDNNGYLARYEAGFQFQEGAEARPRRDRVRVLNLDGSQRATLLAFPARSFVVVQQSVTPNPWGHNGFVRLGGGGRLYYAWSDTLGVTTYDLAGRRQGGFRHVYTPPATTQRDLEYQLSQMPADMGAGFRNALADSLPRRWPAVRGLLVDHRDRVWLELAGPMNRETEWSSFSADGEYLGSVLVPAAASVYHIGEREMYAKRADDDGTPRLVQYRMARPPR